MLKRKATFLSIFSLLLSLPLNPVNITSNACASCSNAGITSVASGKKFTYIKSGTNLSGIKELQIARSLRNRGYKVNCDWPMLRKNNTL